MGSSPRGPNDTRELRLGAGLHPAALEGRWSPEGLCGLRVPLGPVCESGSELHRTITSVFVCEEV